MTALQSGASIKGWRTIDFSRLGNGGIVGLGDTIGPGQKRDVAIARVGGSLDRDTVGAKLDTLKLQYMREDVERIAFAIDTMRITERRSAEGLDQALALIEKLHEVLPEALKQVEAEEASSAGLSNRFRLSEYRWALEKLGRATESVIRTKCWEQTTQTWHDDAMFFGLAIHEIAVRPNQTARLSFRSFPGPAIKFVQWALEIGSGLRVEGDAIRKAIARHPQGHTLLGSG